MFGLEIALPIIVFGLIAGGIAYAFSRQSTSVNSRSGGYGSRTSTGADDAACCCATVGILALLGACLGGNSPNASRPYPSSTTRSGGMFPPPPRQQVSLGSSQQTVRLG